MELVLEEAEGNEGIYVEDLLYLLACEPWSVRTGAQNGETRYGINENFRFAQAGLTGRQHDAPSFDTRVKRIARPQAQLAADRDGQHDLALARDSRLHGKTILPWAQPFPGVPVSFTNSYN